MTEYLVILGILFIIDTLTTKAVLKAGGSEGNIIVRTLINTFGENTALWGSKIVAFAIIYYLTMQGTVAVSILQILTALYAIIAVWNLHVLRQLKKKNG